MYLQIMSDWVSRASPVVQQWQAKAPQLEKGCHKVLFPIAPYLHSVDGLRAARAENSTAQRLQSESRRYLDNCTALL